MQCNTAISVWWLYIITAFEWVCAMKMQNEVNSGDDHFSGQNEGAIRSWRGEADKLRMRVLTPRGYSLDSFQWRDYCARAGLCWLAVKCFPWALNPT